jgi:phenylacetate-CoA ligase
MCFTKIKDFFFSNILQSQLNNTPEKALSSSKDKAIQAFKKACENWPFYHQIIKNSGLNPSQVVTLEDFQKLVPLMDKQKIFDQTVFPLPANTQSILLSSGSTGTFSFGLNSSKDNTLNTEFLNVMFNYFFNIFQERTLIVNCLSQAVNLPSINATIIEIGPRSDSMIYALKQFAPLFGQTIIVGDNYFIKNALEDGLGKLDYKKLQIHLILGGVYLPENLRTHLLHLLQNPNAIIISSMGISEFGLNLFFESKELIQLRRLVKNDEKLRQRLLTAGYPSYLPMFFNYFPQNYFIEENQHNIVITNLNSKALLPLIRYNTFDQGRIVFYNELKGLLPEDSELLPPFKSPLVLMYGRANCLAPFNIYPEQIQEGIYEDSELACQATGYFRLNLKEHKPYIEIQLKKGIGVSEELMKAFSAVIFKQTRLECLVTLYSYMDFPYGMELDYERKFKFL